VTHQVSTHVAAHTTDVLVAGGGPAGLATAIRAVQAGFTTTVVDRRAGVVDKACGEGLMPSALAALGDLGVQVPGRPFHGIRYVDANHAAEGRFRIGPGLGVRRLDLHAALHKRADQVGVRRVTGMIDRVRQCDEWVEAAGERARWLIGADGLHSTVRRELGLELPARHRARYGLRRHFAVEPWTDLVEVHWSADAEAYVTPVSDGCVGVAVLFSGRGNYDDLLTKFPVLAGRLDGAAPVTAVRGAGPFEQRVRRRVAGRVLLVGDAAGYVDALTGEGINLGLTAAQALVAALVAGEPTTYEAAWARLSRRYRMVTSSLLWARRRPWLQRRIVPAAERLPWVFRGTLDVLS
jgi:flavin-dependent dehydrogenase